MKKTLRLKSLLLIATLLVGATSVWADEVTVDLSKGSFDTDHITWTVGDALTITQTKGSVTTAVNESYVSAPRVYKGHILSFEAAENYSITKISITCSGTYIGNSMIAGTTSTGTSVTSNTNDLSATWATTNGGTHTISTKSQDGVSNIYIQNVASSSNVQLRPTEIKVTYVYVNAETPEHTLSYIVSPAEAGSVTLGATSVKEGISTTITATANTGYRFVNWTVAGEGTEVANASEASTTVKMGTADATLTANFAALAQYTITWSVNGVETTENYYEGSAINFAEAIVPNGFGKAFAGWVTTATVAADETPSFVKSATASANITYYAVFADVVRGEVSTKTDKLQRDLTGVTNTTYTTWSNKTNDNITSGAIYAGQSAGGNGSIQLRTDNSNSGVISTTSGGKIKKVVVTWNASTTKGRTLNIYGSNTAYTNPTQLFNNSSSGTLLGTIVKDTSTELTIEGDYAYIGLRSASGAMYLETITITWEQSTPDVYSNYATTLVAEPTTATITFNSACTDGDLYYATFSCDKAFVVSDDIVVSEISVIDDKLLVEEYKTGDVVPANTGVLVASLESDDVTVELSAEAGESVLGEDNMLRATGEGLTAEAMATADADCVFYRLTMHNGKKLGFWYGAEDGAAFAIDGGKAYLAVPAEQAARLAGFTFGSEATAIATMTANAQQHREVFDLQGRRVAKMQKGLYIVNGKKFINK